MARVQLEISRRTFLKSALAGAGGVALAGRSLEPANAAAPQSAGLDTALPWFRQGAIETTYNVCDMCPWRCGVTVQTVGGVVRKIDGNPLDPKSRGMLCARGQGGVSFIYDPDRLQSPMARTGERGEGKFQEVTWTEALDQSAAKLAAIRDEYGQTGGHPGRVRPGIGGSLEKMREEKGIVIQKGKPYLADFGDASPFPTHSQKIEFYSDILGLAGLDPMPVYEAVEPPPDGFFRLLYGRHPVHTFAKTQNTPLLSELYPENEVWLNADKAAEIGVENGAYVRLENQDGVLSNPIKVKATQRIRGDAVFMAHGFGQNAPGLRRANGKGASDAKLQTRYKLDPISGGAGMRVNFVRIVKEA